MSKQKDQRLASHLQISRRLPSSSPPSPPPFIANRAVGPNDEDRTRPTTGGGRARRTTRLHSEEPRRPRQDEMEGGKSGTYEAMKSTPRSFWLSHRCFRTSTADFSSSSAEILCAQ